jgi:hypothetical protein
MLKRTRPRHVASLCALARCRLLCEETSSTRSADTLNNLQTGIVVTRAPHRDSLLEIPEPLQECSPPILRYFSDIAECGSAFRGHVLHDHSFDCGREISPDIGEFVANRFDHFSVCDICHRDQTPRCILARAYRRSIRPSNRRLSLTRGYGFLARSRRCDASKEASFLS